MKRWRAITARTIAFLLLGAIVNVAVAWALVITCAAPGQPTGWFFWPGKGWTGDVFDSVGMQQVIASSYFIYRPERVDSSILYDFPRWSFIYLVGNADAEPFTRWEEAAYGLPALALSARQEFSAQGTSRVNGVRFKNHLFPIQVILPGFAINTVFYAGILWMLFAAPFALRRRRRINRGLAPQCSYDLRGHAAEGDVCPECGHSVRKAPCFASVEEMTA